MFILAHSYVLTSLVGSLLGLFEGDWLGVDVGCEILC